MDSICEHEKWIMVNRGEEIRAHCCICELEGRIIYVSVQGYYRPYIKWLVEKRANNLMLKEVTDPDETRIIELNSERREPIFLDIE